jgi:tetratricopeptide (TPR) repeat protein
MILKTICSAILLFCSLSLIQAQSPEILAKSAVMNAEEAYGNGQYSDCLSYLKDAETNLGKTNSRIQYLKVKSLMAMGSADQYNKNIWSQTDAELKVFFDVTPENSYVPEKYDEMLMAVSKVKKSLEEAKNGIDSKNIKEWTEDLEKDPNSVYTLINITNYYLKYGQSEKALEYCNRALKIDTHNATLYFAAGCLYEKTGENNKAVEMYKKSIELDPNNSNPYYNLGVFYYNEAVNIFKEAENIPASDANKYNKMIEKGNAEIRLALQFMEKVHQIDPSDKDANETIKVIKFRLHM